MNVTTVKMTWVNVSELPVPFRFPRAQVRTNRYDPSRVYVEFNTQSPTLNYADIFRQIGVWLPGSHCVSIHFSCTDKMPMKELKSKGFTRSLDQFWRKKEGDLFWAIIPLAQARWILTIENRKTSGRYRGIPAEVCDLSNLFSVQLTLNEMGQVVGS